MATGATANQVAIQQTAGAGVHGFKCEVAIGNLLIRRNVHYGQRAVVGLAIAVKAGKQGAGGRVGERGDSQQGDE